MIDISDLEESSEKTKVNPSDNIFKELGNNTYDYKDLVSELIDNAIAAKRTDRILNVTINIYVDSDQKPIKFTITDDASGITQDRLGIAITPAGVQSTDGLNEHGLGMKQAIAALGELEYLATKTVEEDKARVILEFKFGELPTYYSDFDGDSGTELSIKNLKPIIVSHPGTITTSIKPYLGARYRRYLTPDNKKLNLKINIIKQDTSENLYNWDIGEVKPIYFHPSTRANNPVIFRHPLTGEGWNAELTFGYAPKDEKEYEELGLEKTNLFHPYNVTLAKQGLDIIRNDRVILFHQLSEIRIIDSPHNDYNHVRGELILLDGFSTAITKNFVINDKNFLECIEKVRGILNGEITGPDAKKKKYLKGKTYPEQIPENLLRDRLKIFLENNPINKKKIVNTEYVVDGIEGYIDILADGEAWEIKTEQAAALDVYQLFMYMDVKGIKIGWLIAPSFSTGANVAAAHIKKNHGKNITLTNFDHFPITHEPSDEERIKYY